MELSLSTGTGKYLYGWYGDLNKNSPHELIYLNVWFPVGLFRKAEDVGPVGGGVFLG